MNDAERRRRAAIARVELWRAKNPIGRKLADVVRDKTDDQRRANRAEFLKHHQHVCLRCRNGYACANACDPIGEGLDNSICEPCFEEVVSS